MTEGYPEDTQSDGLPLPEGYLAGMPQGLEFIKVRRSDGRIDDGWQVLEHVPADGDTPAYVLVAKSENGETLTKKVLPHHLLEANRPPEEPGLGFDSEGRAADPTGEAFQNMKKDLVKSREKGISFDEIFSRKWQELEIETADGRIVLKRIGKGPDDRSVIVESSDDETLQAGTVIVPEGSSMSGMWMNASLGPGSRMAYKAQRVLHYEIGDKTSDKDMTVTPEDMQDWLSSTSGIFTQSGEGVDVKFFEPKPHVTNSLVGHAALVKLDQNNEPVTEYLF